MRKLLFFTLFVFLTGSAGAETRRGLPLPRLPIEITKPGTYVLRRDFVYAGTAPAITISADNVVLDLNSYSITGNKAAGAIGIKVGDKRNVRIRNGALTNFGIGVEVAGTSNELSGLLISSSRETAIAVAGTGHRVRGNHIAVVDGEGGAEDLQNLTGIVVNGPQHQITDNIISQVRHPAIPAQAMRILSAPGVQVKGNFLSNREMNALSTAILLSGGATDALVEENAIMLFTAGIVFQDGAGGHYRGNTTVSVNSPYFGGSNGGGNQ